MASLGVSGIVRITSDAEARKSTSGTFFSFGIAAYRKFAKEGKQDVDFFDATIYSKDPPATLQASLKKGQLMYIQGGDLLNDKFVGNDGKDKTRVKIKVLSYEFFNPAEKAKEIKEPVKEVAKAVAAPVVVEDEPLDDEDIPF